MRAGTESGPFALKHFFQLARQVILSVGLAQEDAAAPFYPVLLDGGFVIPRHVQHLKRRIPLPGHGHQFRPAHLFRHHHVGEQGSDNLETYDSSPDVHRRFCRTCGCHLLLNDDRWPHLQWFTPGTLEEGAHPGHPKDTEKHIFVASKMPWHTLADGLPQFEGFQEDV
ncbi:MAG: GFA family protein [Proteobacteria bacterium]|nr:GFA family protein [Pseudomonadota bacterium]